MWETTDPDGRRVVLSWLRWSHIRAKHPELDVPTGVILVAVHDPDERLAGREHGEEWFFRREVGPSSWMKVVVHYEQDLGLIATAFPRRSLP